MTMSLNSSTDDNIAKVRIGVVAAVSLRTQYLLCLVQSVIKYISSPAAADVRFVWALEGLLTVPSLAVEKPAGVK